MAIFLNLNVWLHPSTLLATDTGNATPKAPLQGPLLGPGSSSVVKENVNQRLPTAPDSFNQNEEATHSALIDEVDEAVQLPERSGAPIHIRDTSHPPALMELFNYPIAIFRGSLYGYTPADREQANEARIDKYFEEEYSGVITTGQRAEGIMILIDRKNAFMLIPGDVDPFTGQTLEEYVGEVVKKLDIALKISKEQRSTPYLLKAAGFSLLATFVFGLLIWGVNSLQGRVRPHIFRLKQAFNKKCAIAGFSFWSI